MLFSAVEQTSHVRKENMSTSAGGWVSDSHVSRVARRISVDLHHTRDKLRAAATLAPSPRVNGTVPVANRDVPFTKWKKALNIGHKGAAGHVEGNTMSSFVEAIRLGVDMIEFDVLTTLDGVVICHHDPLIEETGEWINTLTLAQTRARLKHDVPTFEEMLQEKAIVDSDVHLYIDMKHTDIVRPVLHVVSQAVDRWGWNADRLLVATFRQMDLLLVNAFRQAIPDLAKLRTVCIMDGFPFTLGRDFAELEVAALAVGKDHITTDLVADCQRRGIQVWAWTVNSKHFMERLLKMGVDGIITDFPEMVHQGNKKLRPATNDADEAFPEVRAHRSIESDLSGERDGTSTDFDSQNVVLSPCDECDEHTSRSELKRLMAAVYGDFVGVRDFAVAAVEEAKILTKVCAKVAPVREFLGSEALEGTMAAKELEWAVALCEKAEAETEHGLLPMIGSQKTREWLLTVLYTQEGRDFTNKLTRTMQAAPEPLLAVERIFIRDLVQKVST